MQIAEDGGLESAIRCDRGLKVAYFYHGILTNKVIEIGLICLITTSI
jgi:alanine dehydrogenase